MSILNLAKVGATCFVVGAAIGGGYAAYRKHKAAKAAVKETTELDEFEQKIRSALEAAGVDIVDLKVTRN